MSTSTYIEDYVPVVKYNGLNSAAVVTLSGAVTFSGATIGLRKTSEIQLTGTGDTLLTAESGTVMIATKASATQTYVLPSAATAGLVFTFICGSASGEILIDPAGSDTIKCKAAADGASVAPAGGTGIKNTAASNILGDWITLVSDGVTGWYAISQSGIFASQ
jgi:hypothetical protein|tara:strand:- start:850 stop:1338 length:489 start_codon:yes stop_codon:yes gene_type:complete